MYSPYKYFLFTLIHPYPLFKMPVLRNPMQKDTLQAFYQDFIDKASFPYMHIARKMLNLLEVIDDIFENTEIWGLTSHAELTLQIAPESNEMPAIGDAIGLSCWYKNSIAEILEQDISQDDLRDPSLLKYFEYRIECSQDRNYDLDTIKVDTLEEAKNAVLTKMQLCDPWKQNDELKQYLIGY